MHALSAVSLSDRREKEGERERERERGTERAREREREREGERENTSLLLTIAALFKGMTGALALFSYLVCI